MGKNKLEIRQIEEKKSPPLHMQFWLWLHNCSSADGDTMIGISDIIGIGMIKLASVVAGRKRMVGRKILATQLALVTF